MIYIKINKIVYSQNFTVSAPLAGVKYKINDIKISNKILYFSI